MASVASYLGQSLAREGIKYMFGYPGGATVELAEMARRSGTEFVLAHSEWAAGYMAGMYGDLTGRPGVLATTLGPGATNAVNATAQAYLDRQPMLTFTGRVSLRDGNHAHQNLDQRAIFGPVTKWSTTVSGASFARNLRRAMRIATDERPGPVHFDIPADEAQADCPETDVVPLHDYQRAYGPAGAIDAAAGMLLASRRPVLIAGNTARRRGASAGIAQLAERKGIPVLTTPKAKGVIDERHPLWAGVIQMAGHRFMDGLISRADLVIAVGFDPVELITAWNQSAPVLHIDYTSNTDDVYTSALDLIGDINATCSELASSRLGASGWTERDLADHRRQYLETVVLNSNELTPSHVVFATREAAPESSIMISDVGSHKMLLGGLWPTYSPNTFFMSNGLGTMGIALPSAIATQLVYPDRRVICGVGDGGLAMVAGELGTVADRELPILIIVFNDGALDRIRRKQWANSFPAVGTEFGNPDFVRLAESYGISAYGASSKDEFAKALAKAQEASGPFLIDAKIDTEEYDAQFRS